LRGHENAGGIDVRARHLELLVGARFCDCGDGDSEFDGGESEREVERNAYGAERIQRKRGADMYGRSSWDVRDHAGDADANCGRSWVYGDVGQRYGWDV